MLRLRHVPRNERACCGGAMRIDRASDINNVCGAVFREKYFSLGFIPSTSQNLDRRTPRLGLDYEQANRAVAEKSTCATWGLRGRGRERQILTIHADSARRAHFSPPQISIFYDGPGTSRLYHPVRDL